MHPDVHVVVHSDAPCNFVMCIIAHITYLGCALRGTPGVHADVPLMVPRDAHYRFATCYAMCMMFSDVNFAPIVMYVLLYNS